MNNPPPPYSTPPLGLDRHNSSQSYHRNSGPHYATTPIQTSIGSSHHSVQSPQTATSERGLGGLMVGLGAAAMLNNAMSQTNQTHSPNPTPGREDPLAVLGRFDTILLIDDSASMAMGDLWREASAAVSGVADTLVRYDSG